MWLNEWYKRRPGRPVYLDAFTLANTINNTADFYPDIDGSYILQ
jgi:hypothetical protein